MVERGPGYSNAPHTCTTRDVYHPSCPTLSIGLRCPPRNSIPLDNPRELLMTVHNHFRFLLRVVSPRLTVIPPLVILLIGGACKSVDNGKQPDTGVSNRPDVSNQLDVSNQPDVSNQLDVNGSVRLDSSLPPTAISITSQPTDQQVVAGQTATFSVIASGVAPLAYQWKKSGANIGGATSPSYETPATSIADNNAQFTVTVTNTSGSITSTPATLRVTATAVAPVISIQPQSQSVTVGQTATFAVAATGTAPLSYQWKKGGTNIGGATSATYTTTAATLTDNGSIFTVTVTNAVSSVTSSGASLNVTDGKGLFLNGYFPIGVFGLHLGEFEKWRDRGVNAAVFAVDWFEPGNTLKGAVQEWDRTAKAAGMRTIRPPLPDPKDDVGNTTLLAWMQMDEPQTTGAGLKNLAPSVSNYQTWKAIDPTRPVFLNFAGPDVLVAIEGPKPDWCQESTGGCALVSNHLDYINKALDWVANDIYPSAGYLPDKSRRNDVAYVGDPIDKIREWTDKPQLCFIETSFQRYVPDSTRGPTKDEVRAQIWVGIIHGVRGFIYFPAVVPYDGVGATSDGTPADVAAELIVQNKLVTQLAPVLQGDINPSSLGATVAAPLQAGWRDAPTGRYFFVVNTKGSTLTNASVTFTGAGAATSATVLNESRSLPLSNGKLTDTFGPFAVHVYVVAK